MQVGAAELESRAIGYPPEASLPANVELLCRRETVCPVPTATVGLTVNRPPGA